jgi:hypothetical protein
MPYTEIIITALVTAAVMVVLWLVITNARGGGPHQRVVREVGARLQRDPAFAARVEELLAPPKPPEPPKPSGEPLRLLALLQREGRLLDFLVENIDDEPNEKIGAGVRNIHRDCHKAIGEHLVLDAVLRGDEGSTVEVPPGFDPSAIQLIGNVTGQPPFRGTLRHHGWRVREIKLAKPPKGQDEFVVQPAVVELT